MVVVSGKEKVGVGTEFTEQNKEVVLSQPQIETNYHPVIRWTSHLHRAIIVLFMVVQCFNSRSMEINVD